MICQCICKKEIELITFKNRNLQKRAKKARYEAEKVLMGTLRDVGCAVGEYMGDGKGEADTREYLSDDPVTIQTPKLTPLTTLNAVVRVAIPNCHYLYSMTVKRQV